MREQLGVFDTLGKQILTIESVGEEAFITSIAVQEDKIFVAEAQGKKIIEYSHQGKPVSTIGTRDSNELTRFILPSYFFDVAFDSDGFLWAANTGMHKLVSFKKDGSLRAHWGETSSMPKGFCGCCNPSHFAILESGNFVTSEKGIVRVKEYNQGGDFICVIAGPETFAKGSEGLDIAVDSKQRIWVLEPKTQTIHVFYKE